MKKLLLTSSLLALVCASPAFAQANNSSTNGTWSSGTPQGTPVWDTSGILGSGSASTCGTGEYFNATQGGCPPATETEPTAVNEGANYTRSQWLTTFPAGTCIEAHPENAHYGEDTGCRPWEGSDKIRLVCGFAKFAQVDSLVAPGAAQSAHPHTWFGNVGVNKDSWYGSLRANPKSTCAGGPLAATAYGIASLMYEVKPNVFVEVIPEGVEVYYDTDGRDSPKLTRLQRGVTVIGGWDPSDPTNSARLAELAAQPPAAGQTWTLTSPGNSGFIGYKCVRRTPDVNGAAGNVLFANGDQFAQSWLNTDGTNPWGTGQCEGANYQIWSYLTMPTCWNGKDRTSPGGRGEWRYEVTYNNVRTCPRNWFFVPGLTSIHFYPAFTHAKRQKMWLSSDMMGSDRANWRQPGTTAHADWEGAWDDVVFQLLQKECLGVTINGVTRVGGTGTLLVARTCATGVIADSTALITGTSPDTNMAPTPMANQPNLGNVPSKLNFGPVPTGTKVNGSINHPHTM